MRDISYDTPMSREPSPLRCQGGKTRMQARLLLSHESFSLEKKPQIWCFGGEEAGEEGSRREKTRRK